MLKKILEVEKNYNGGFYLDFATNGVYLLIDDSHSTREVGVLKAITTERIDKIANVVATPKIIVDALSLTPKK